MNAGGEIERADIIIDAGRRYLIARSLERIRMLFLKVKPTKAIVYFNQCIHTSVGDNFL